MKLVTEVAGRRSKAQPSQTQTAAAALVGATIDKDEGRMTRPPAGTRQEQGNGGPAGGSRPGLEFNSPHAERAA